MLDNHSALGKEKSTIYLFIFIFFLEEKSTITVTFMPMMTFVNL